MKKLFCLMAPVLLSACGGGGGASTPAPAPQQAAAVFVPVTVSSCDKNAWPKMAVGDYAVTNNLWGKGSISNFTQCISATSVGTVENNKAVQTGVTAKWNWSWPDSDFNVKSYAEILYQPQGQPLDPIPFAALGALTVKHDVTIDATGDYNLAYDMWVDATKSVGQWPHKAEIMIKLQGTWKDSPVVDTITVDGVSYDVCVDNGPSRQWTFLAFTSTTPMPKATIRVKPFVDYLLAKGYLASTDYLSTIEFGSELVKGTGTATVNAYSVTR
ncbi:MAG: GH12 family glycosyl hydrolase domain-containing protein [Telluria sp.]